ncbi:hypothetical protein IIC_06115 [Bacillus cereus VD021]|uniref:Uncharacterized protein n=1 Tax=Bacillus cereus VD021 TaxID=1053224 RepID=R8GY35_BACCE|nr:hypothetical protein IIC_06115 [Bacillus cereus VD021]
MYDAIEWEVTDYILESDLKGEFLNDEGRNDYPAFFE